MPDFVIQSLRGGLSEDPPTSIADDQCAVARNVEFWVSMLGERRLGAQTLNLAGSPLAGCVRIVWLFRHLPTALASDAQLWVLGINSDNSATLAYKDTAWHTVAMPDPLVVDIRQFEVQGQTLHGKLFIAYKSSVNRLHVWDNGATALRRTGLALAPGPSAILEFGTGTFVGTRYYRARWTVRVGGVVIRRSEAGGDVIGTPSGSAQGLRLSPPPAINEGETDWELEASIDHANFYRIGTAAAGATIDDTTPYAQGYAQTFPLSDESGAYGVIPSVRYLTAEQDRLMGGGSFDDHAEDSSVLWTPVFNDPTGVGNDERIPVASSNSLRLDGYEGGPLTGLSATVNGYVYATKQSHIYQMTRSGLRAHAYDAIPLSKQRGALPGSMVEAFDQYGNPTPFFLDPDIGPCSISPRGIEPCGADIRATWHTVHLDATLVIARACYFNEKKQVHWWVATGASADVPNLRLVLHTQEMRPSPDGSRRGWAIWDGPSAGALAVCMFADNIDSNGPRSSALVPFVGLTLGGPAGLIWRTDTGTSDNGTAYIAQIRTRPYVRGSLLNQWECHAAMLLAGAVPGGTLDITLRADFGLQEKTITGVTLTPTGAEMRVIKNLDNLGLAELRALQVTFADAAIPTTTQWTLEVFAMKQSPGAGA